MQFNAMETRSIKIIALFDILGTKKRMETLKLDAVLKQYIQLAEFVDNMTGSLMIHSVPAGDGGFCPAVGYLAVEQAYFSDTFLVWADYDSFRIPAFFEMCSGLFCHSLELGIPLRGGIAVGDAYMDKEKNIFLGPALIDAYLAESAGEWLGISCGNSFGSEQYRGPFDPRTVLPYSRHQNQKKEYKLEGLVLDWPRLWRKTERPDACEKLRFMDTEIEFQSYYSNTIAFVEASAQKHNWWEFQKSLGKG